MGNHTRSIRSSTLDVKLINWLFDCSANTQHDETDKVKNIIAYVVLKFSELNEQLYILCGANSYGFKHTTRRSLMGTADQKRNYYIQKDKAD